MVPNCTHLKLTGARRKQRRKKRWEEEEAAVFGMGSRMKHFDPLTAPLNSPNPLKDTNEGQGGLENEVLDRWEACLLHAAEIEFACQRVHDKGGQKAVREVAHI